MTQGWHRECIDSDHNYNYEREMLMAEEYNSGLKTPEELDMEFEKNAYILNTNDSMKITEEYSEEEIDHDLVKKLSEFNQNCSE